MTAKKTKKEIPVELAAVDADVDGDFAPLDCATMVITIFRRTVCDWLAIVFGTLSAGRSSSGFLPPVLSNCSDEVNAWIVGLLFGMDDGTKTRTCDPCCFCLLVCLVCFPFFLSLLRVLTPPLFAS